LINDAREQCNWLAIRKPLKEQGWSADNRGGMLSKMTKAEQEQKV
jgi:hypothetical protein